MYRNILKITILLVVLYVQYSHVCYTDNNGVPLNYYHQYSPNTSTCQPCFYSCTSCTNSTSCSSCQQGYFLTNSNTSCFPCPTNCQICTSNLNCQSCNSGYYLNGMTCYICTFTGASVCSISSPLNCSSGYYYNNSLCNICILNCYSCSDGISCNTCNDYYFYNGSSCTACSIGCIECNNLSNCLICDLGYYLSSGLCTSYTCNVNNCIKCSTGASICDLCNSGYIMYNNTCIKGSSLLCNYSTSSFDFGSCYSCTNASYSPPYSPTYCIPNTNKTSINSIFLASLNNPEVFSPITNICDLSVSSLNSSFTYAANLTPSYSITIYLNLFLLNVTNSTVSINMSLLNISSSISYNNTVTYSYCSSVLTNIKASLTVSQLASPNITVNVTSSFNFGISQIFIVQYLCQSANCLTCVDSVHCTSCVSGFYLLISSCVSSCGSGYYTNYYTQKCRLICQYGYYPDLTQYICSLCVSPCLSCNTTTICLSCGLNNNFTQTYLYNNICYTSCPSNLTYPDPATNACISCINPCLSCSSTGTNCTSCLSGYYVNNSCVSQCPVGTFSDFSTTLIQCSPCNSSCLSCQLSSTNCQTCSNTSYLYNSQCLTNCPPYYYYPDNQNICLPCVSPCLTCTFSNQNCTSCSVGSYIFDSTNFIGACTINCPIGSYSLNNICVNCSQGCSTCINATYCNTCQTVNITNYYFFNNTCLSSCPSTYSYSTNICLPCPFPCLACNQTNSTQCFSCQNVYLLLNTSCVTVCPTGYYQSTSACSVCSQNCLSCANNSTCTACLPNITNYILNSNNVCTNSCASGQFAFKNISVNTFACSACSSICLTCYQKSTMCTSCFNSTYLLQSNYTCSTTCPDSFYANSTNNICSPCSPSCKTCNISSLSCLSCNINTYLYNSTCTTTCPTGFYKDLSTSVCQQCNNKCLSCDFLSYCTACNSNYTLYNGQCIGSCPSNWISLSQVCVKCNSSNCLSCNISADNCSSCSRYYYLQINTTSNKYFCGSTCPTYYYSNFTTSTCDPCVSPCLTCLQIIQCISCINSTYLYQHSCVSTCPNTTYPQQSTCLPCIAPCSQCSSNTTCLACIPNWYLNNNSCTQTCAIGYYRDNLTGTCSMCVLPCLVCSTATICSQCSNGFYLLNSACSNLCPTGQFQNFSSLICQYCAFPCATCINSSSTCLTCTTNYLLLNSTCYNSTCPSHYYAAYDISYHRVCLICSAACQNCSVYSVCTSCSSPLVLQNNECISSCGNYYFNNSNICVACSSNCVSCQNATVCVSCTNAYLFTNNTCVTTCPDGYFPIDGNYTCAACPSVCQKCYNTYICTQCVTGYALLQSNCIALPCPSLYFRDIFTQTCVLQCSSSTLIYASGRICYTGACPLPLIYDGDTSCVENCKSTQYINSNATCTSCNQSCPSLQMLSVIPIYDNTNMQLIVVVNQKFKVKTADGFTVVSSINESRLLSASNISTTNYLTIQPFYVKVYLPTSISLSQVQITLYQNTPYLSIVDSNNYPIQNYQVSTQVGHYDHYGYAGTNALAILLILIVLLLYVFHIGINKSYLLWDALDFAQTLYFLAFLDIQYPPSLEPFLSAFSVMNFRFLPTFNPQQFLQSPNKVHQYATDLLFYRNIGQNLFLLFLILMFLATIWLIRRFDTKLKIYCQRMWNKERQIIIQCILVGYLSLNVFSFLQYNNTEVDGDAFLGFNLASAVVASLCCFLMATACIYQLYTQATTKEKKQQIWHHGFYQIDMDKIYTGILINGYKVVRKLLFGLVFGIYPENPIYVLTIMMLASVTILLVVQIYRPYENEVRNILNIVQESIFCLAMLLILILSLNKDMSLSGKLAFGAIIQVVCILLLAVSLYLPCKEAYVLIKGWLSADQETMMVQQESNKKVMVEHEIEQDRKPTIKKIEYSQIQNNSEFKQRQSRN